MQAVDEDQLDSKRQAEAQGAFHFVNECLSDTQGFRVQRCSAQASAGRAVACTHGQWFGRSRPCVTVQLKSVPA